MQRNAGCGHFTKPSTAITILLDKLINWSLSLPVSREIVKIDYENHKEKPDSGITPQSGFLHGLYVSAATPCGPTGGPSGIPDGSGR